MIGKNEHVPPSYLELCSNSSLNYVYRKVVEKMEVEKKYLDPTYSARQLMDEIGTNMRYLSATIRTHFQCNYSQMVNEYRVKEAMRILRDDDTKTLKLQEIGLMVGFSNRQSFYQAFIQHTGLSPKAFREDARHTS